MEKKLNYYDVSEVIDTFDIHKNRNCEVLNDWVDVNGTLNIVESEITEQARKHLALKWDEWNEEELKMHFISLVFFIARLDESKKIYTFFERRFAGVVDGISVSLIVDCMLASATNAGLPKLPYFFLQEAPPRPSPKEREKKRSLGDDHDPEGQMLAAMILGQEKNADNQTLFGSWIQGRFWYFTTLRGNQYCVSEPYNATNPKDLLQIIFILRKLKELILKR